MKNVKLIVPIISLVCAAVESGAVLLRAPVCPGTLELANGNMVPMRCAYTAKVAVLLALVLAAVAVAAEPAVHVLNKQVERRSAGGITSAAMKKGLCIGVSISLGLAMLRIITGINIMWILIPGYVIALVLTFFTPALFTGIAFDSGGVASGAMVSSFVLPMAIGACNVLQGTGDIMTLAFGCVAFVALTPLISIQILGIHYKHKTYRIKRNILHVEDKILEYEVERWRNRISRA